MIIFLTAPLSQLSIEVGGVLVRSLTELLQGVAVVLQPPAGGAQAGYLSLIIAATQLQLLNLLLITLTAWKPLLEKMFHIFTIS